LSPQSDRRRAVKNMAKIALKARARALYNALTPVKYSGIGQNNYQSGSLIVSSEPESRCVKNKELCFLMSQLIAGGAESKATNFMDKKIFF